MKSKMYNRRIQVFVRDRSKILFQGEAVGLTSANSKGTFDILVNHANFITLIDKALFIHLPDGSIKSVPMDSAIIKTKENKVEVYVGVKR